MEQISNEIRVGYSDREINALLEGIGDVQRPFSRHFSQGEDFFLQLEGEYTVPPMPIHHDVRLGQPSTTYLSALRGVLEQITRLSPQIMRDLLYFFDPAEIMRPCFYRVYRVEDSLYLYLMRIDLMIRPAEGIVIQRGTNDTTAHYRSRRLFLESTLIPLEGVARRDDGVKALRVMQTISQTWIGEHGRGYFQQGIWMDADLTRFFSRLFLPAAMRTYPFFPYQCKYKTVCQSVIRLAPENRAVSVPWLHRVLRFLLPNMDRIQAEMKNASFSEDLPFFRELKRQVPPSWYDPWNGVRVESYLNQSEMKEFRIED